MVSTPTKRTSHSRSGCATCRRRRVRCDERKEVCANCERLGIPCSWYRPTEVTQRSRVNTACDRCRTKKIKCTAQSSTGPCGPCQSAGVDCVNEHGLSPPASSIDGRVAAAAASPAAAVLGQAPESAELRRLLDAYFEGPHYHCFYGFIHRPTFEQMFESGQVPKSLLLIVIATSLHFIEPQSPLADQWADECRRLVMLDIFSPPSTTTLQALLLLQRYEWHRASHVGAWFLSGLALRLAHGLQLNIEILDRARVPVTVRETRRRLVWSCFIMESMIEGGRKPLSGLEASSIEVKLPCNENSFDSGLETNMPDLQQLYDPPFGIQRTPFATSSSTPSPENRLGISAFLVKLAELRRDILNWTLPYHPRNKGHIPSETPWALDSPFFRFEDKLERWYMHLPEELRFNTEVLHRRRLKLINFETLHCLFHGCYCDLYRIGSYLTASQRGSGPEAASSLPPPSFLAACRRGRLQNALGICNVLSHGTERPPSGYDPVVGISAALAMRVLVIERQAEESGTLGLTNEAVFARLGPAIQCAKWIARRSVPIRDLFCSVCALAKQRGLHIDLSDIGTGTNLPDAANQQQDQQREGSPSLRTYGTFGSIQSTLAMRNDVHAPAASSSTDKESDLFKNFGSFPPTASQTQAGEVPSQGGAAGEYNSSWDTSFVPGEGFSPNELTIASGWADGTLSFSMMPVQFDWVNQSLRFDFNNENASSAPQVMW